MGRVSSNVPDSRLEIIYHPDKFAEGVRILMLTTRSKEGGRTNNPDRQKTNKKYVTRNKDEYYEKLDELICKMTPQQRIYSTVDDRNLDRAEREFKFRLLESDYYDDESRHSFYIDVWNRWISCLQSPPARNSQHFLFDIDNDGDNDNVDVNTLFGVLNSLGVNPYVYETKNGHHVVCDPFNPKLINAMNAKPQKNAMLLVAYYNNYIPVKVAEEPQPLQEYNGRT